MAAPLMALSIVKTTSITTSGASANAAIPNDASGVAAKAIRIATTAAAYFRVGKGAQTAVAGDILVQPGDALIIACGGSDNIAAIQVAAAGVVSVAVVENYA